MEGRLFFEFLQVAIGNRESLSGGVADADWHRLFEFCKKQALIGVGFSAVEKLHVVGAECPPQLRMQFGSGDRYIDSLMRKASDLVTVRNGYFGTDKHGFKKRHGGLRNGDGLIS